MKLKGRNQGSSEPNNPCSNIQLRTAAESEQRYDRCSSEASDLRCLSLRLDQHGPKGRPGQSCCDIATSQEHESQDRCSDLAHQVPLEQVETAAGGRRLTTKEFTGEETMEPRSAAITKEMQLRGPAWPR